MSDTYIAHMMDHKRPLYTLCGSQWQGWQAPEDLTAKDPLAQTLPPHEEPRHRRDRVHQCQACLKLLTKGAISV